MNVKKFNEAMQALKFTQVELAELMGVSERMVRRWQHGLWPVPVPIAMLLNAMLDRKLSRKTLRSN